MRTSGQCSVYGKFTYLDAEQAYETDKDGNKVPLVEKDKDGKPVLDENGKPIPVYVPARVNVQTGCFPAGPHCSQEAHVDGALEEKTDHSTHTGSTVADCKGTSGTCNITGAVAYDPTTGKVQAFSDCSGTGASACTRSETHTYAWAESPDSKIDGDGHSDCKQATGYCSSVSIAKYTAEYTEKSKPCPTTCFQAVPKTIPEHIVTGATCDTDGPAANCSYDFSARGDRTAEDGDLVAAAKSNCSDSGTVGGGWCSVAATAKVDAEKHSAQAVAWCEGSDGVACSYSANAGAKHETDKNNAEASKSCGASRTGTCSLAVSAYTAGGDDERQGIAVAAGACSDTNGTCKGEFRTHVDSNRDTLADCHSDGNGLCYGVATAKSAETGGSVDDDRTVLHLSTKAPGGEDTKDCSEAAPCQDRWVEALDGKYMGISRETEKSVGGFFKNLARDGGSVILHAVPGFVGAVGKELWSWATAAEFGEGLDGYAENRPLTGGIAKGAVGFKERWIDGDLDKIGDDYYFAPVSTALEDVGTVALLAFGAGAVLKAISLGAKGTGALAASSTTTAGMRGMLTSIGTRAGVWAPRVDAAANGVLRAANVGGHVAMLPLKLNFMAARFVLGRGMAAALPGLSTRAAAGASALAERGMGALEAGRTLPGFRYLGAAGMLERTAGGLRTGAAAAEVIGRGGIFGRITIGGRHVPGLLSTMRAYDQLGLSFGQALTPDQVAAAYRGATVRVHGDGLAGPTGVARVIGTDAATALRLSRLDRAVRVVQVDQLLREQAARAATLSAADRSAAAQACGPCRGTSCGRAGRRRAGRRSRGPARRVAEEPRHRRERGRDPRPQVLRAGATERAAFLRMSAEERAKFVDSQQWTKAALGFAIERMGLPIVDAQLKPGEQVFTNVLVEFVGKGRRAPFPDLDFLVVNGTRATHLVSAKGRPDRVQAPAGRAGCSGRSWRASPPMPRA